MPRKNGVLTRKERIFAHHMANGADHVAAATRAGYAAPHSAASQLATRPAVLAEHVRAQVERMQTEGLQTAVDCLLSIAGDPRAPAGARVQASKVILDRTLGTQELEGADHSSLSPERLAELIAQLNRTIEAKARDVTPVPSDPSVFD